jgi:hypothetical protein
MSVYLAGQGAAAADVEARLKSESVHIILLAEFQFLTGTIYTSNENIPFTDPEWGYTWQGMGDLVSVGSVSGGTNSLAPAMEYVLGIPWEVLDSDERSSGVFRIPQLIGNQSEYRGRSAKLWEQVMSDSVLDSQGRPTAVGIPTALHTGTMDSPTASFSAAGASISMTVESVLIRAGAANFGRLTHRDQLRRYPGDNGLRFVPEVVDTEVEWTEW